MANEIKPEVIAGAAAAHIVFLILLCFCVLCRASRNKQRTPNVCRFVSMSMFVVFYLWLCYVVGCEISQCSEHGSIHYSLRYFAFAVLGISYLFVVIESGFSQDLSYLNNFSQDETAWQYIQSLQRIPPKFHMFVQCYHNETRTRDVSYTDSHGNRQTRTEQYTERVTTFAEDAYFLYGSWTDVSEDTVAACEAAIARVKVDPTILFGDRETFDNYKTTSAAMVERNRHRDAFIDFLLRIEIPGMKDKFLGYVNLQERPFWMRPLFFWIATLLQLTWPYRWLFRAKTGKIHYTLKKKIYSSAIPPIEGDLPPMEFNAADLMVTTNTSWTASSSVHPAQAIPLMGMSNNSLLEPYPLHPLGNPVTGPCTQPRYSQTGPSPSYEESVTCFNPLYPA